MTNSPSTAFDRVLVVFDGVSSSVGMLDYALSMNSSVKHVTVLLLDRSAQSETNRADANVGRILARYCAGHPTVRVVQATPREDISESIVTSAQGLRSQLIVLAIQDQHTNGQDGGPAKLVSEAVALAADIPVMTLRPELVTGSTSRPLLRRILVPLDGSTASRQALPVARALAIGTGAPVQLVMVIDPARVLPAAYAYMPESDPDRCDAIASLEYQANQSLNHAESALRSVGIRVSSALLCGSTQACLLGAIQNGDVVVMATHGEGKGLQSRFGSVTFAVVRHSPQPVVVLHSSPSTLMDVHGSASWGFDAGPAPSLSYVPSDLSAVH